jgi:hypothetical protein
MNTKLIELLNFDKIDFTVKPPEKADLYSSYHYSINPEKNRIRKARFSKAEIAGLLNQYDIEIL